MLVDASWIREVFIGGENNPISHPTPTQLGDKAPAASPSAPKDPELLREGDREGKNPPKNPPKPFGGYLESLGLRPPVLPVLLRAPCPSSTCSGPRAKLPNPTWCKQPRPHFALPDWPPAARAVP